MRGDRQITRQQRAEDDPGLVQQDGDTRGELRRFVSKKRLSWWERYGEPALVIVVVLAIWEALTRFEILPSQDIPPATAIAEAFFRDIQQLRIWEAVGVTMGAWAVGFIAAVAIGIPIGMLSGSTRIAYLMTQPTLEFIRTIPSIAALPLLILLVGTGPDLASVMVFLGGVWPILIQTMYGVRDVDPVTRDAGRAYGLGRVRLFTRIVVPTALPYIATGMRLAAVLGLILAVAASLIGGGDGLGAVIFNASLSGVKDLMFARIFLTGLLGLGMTYSLVAIESKVLGWHTSQRKLIT